MTSKEFEIFWESNYPDCPAIGYLLRKAFPDRWFRIHSLPESKRYPENEEDRKILLVRQNEIITDILGNKAELLLVTGAYFTGNDNDFENENSNLLKCYNFTEMSDVDLHKLDEISYDEGALFKPSFTKINWNANAYNPILAAVAEDEIQLFFISTAKM